MSTNPLDSWAFLHPSLLPPSLVSLLESLSWKLTLGKAPSVAMMRSPRSIPKPACYRILQVAYVRFESKTLACHLLTHLAVYLGDSATLSYLQFIRMIVESVDGPSQFTMDPSRHRLMEATTNLPPDTKPPVLLPDWKTADVLVKAYFTNVSPLHLGVVLSTTSHSNQKIRINRQP